MSCEFGSSLGISYRKTKKSIWLEVIRRLGVAEPRMLHVPFTRNHVVSNIDYSSKKREHSLALKNIPAFSNYSEVCTSIGKSLMNFETSNTYHSAISRDGKSVSFTAVKFE